MKSARKNYDELSFILKEKYEEVQGVDFYKFVFPYNENRGELNADFSSPNAVYLYKDKKDEGTKRQLRRRIMLGDTWEEDYKEFIELNPLTLCSGLAYRGRVNRLQNAQQMNALVFDLDSVGTRELQNLIVRMGQEPSYRTLPQPTFIAISGTGLHLYYVFKEPVQLYPNIKLQMKQLKYDLTFRIWDYKGTSKEENIQYQGINQGFRMVGSINSKYGLPVKAYRTGGKVTLDNLNRYAIEKKNQVDLAKKMPPTKYTKEEAKALFPEWYEKVIVRGDKSQKHWVNNDRLYYWWMEQMDKSRGGHRYHFLMTMAVYAVKCGIPKEQLRKDIDRVFEKLKRVAHENELEERDKLSALEVYDRKIYNFTIDDIIKNTGIHIEKNKRNYRKQDQHLKLARGQLALLIEMEEVKTGRPSKESLVKDYIKEHPKANPTEISKALNVSRTTVYKYL